MYRLKDVNRVAVKARLPNAGGARLEVQDKKCDERLVSRRHALRMGNFESRSARAAERVALAGKDSPHGCRSCCNAGRALRSLSASCPTRFGHRLAARELFGLKQEALGL